MGSPEHLVCFHCTATRLPAEESDTEEETITGISWIVVDVKSNQVKKILAVNLLLDCVSCVGVSLCRTRKKILEGSGGDAKLEQCNDEL